MKLSYKGTPLLGDFPDLEEAGRGVFSPWEAWSAVHAAGCVLHVRGAANSEQRVRLKGSNLEAIPPEARAALRPHAEAIRQALPWGVGRGLFIVWFLTEGAAAVEAAAPFHLTPWAYVRDPARFVASLRHGIADGPTGPRGRPRQSAGALLEDLMGLFDRFADCPHTPAAHCVRG